jgi:hypothetical protein
VYATEPLEIKASLAASRRSAEHPMDDREHRLESALYASNARPWSRIVRRYDSPMRSKVLNGVS